MIANPPERERRGNNGTNLPGLRRERTGGRAAADLGGGKAEMLLAEGGQVVGRHAVFVGQLGHGVFRDEQVAQKALLFLVHQPLPGGNAEGGQETAVEGGQGHVPGRSQFLDGDADGIGAQELVAEVEVAAQHGTEQEGQLFLGVETAEEEENGLHRDALVVGTEHADAEHVARHLQVAGQQGPDGQHGTAHTGRGARARQESRQRLEGELVAQGHVAAEGTIDQ